MARARDMMGGGLSAGQATAINGTQATSVSAAGTLQTDATALVASDSIVSTVGSGAGVIVPNTDVGDSMWIYNAGANGLKVYPPASGSQKFNQLSANAAFTLAVNTGCLVKRVSTTQWIALLSA